ncbi:hypothetical protein NKH19_00680 [Mesorhizobium sp. M1338]|uniref:hypothetical protein n=1 Tax=unclassified Mesorhizobium TaxID=325217 RepID=UPI003338745E
MYKNRFSAQRRRIHAFARAWAKAYLGPGPHRPPSIAVGAHVVTDYAVNWLAEHGEMPNGIHTARATRSIPGFYTTYPALEVDFSPLHRLASSGSGNAAAEGNGP